MANEWTPYALPEEILALVEAARELDRTKDEGPYAKDLNAAFDKDKYGRRRLRRSRAERLGMVMGKALMSRW